MRYARTSITMTCMFDSIRRLFCQRETKHMPQIVRFIRKSDTAFDWRMTECYVCYREFGSIPRAFPFDCDHEMCRECFGSYVSHNYSAGKPNPTCGMCSKPIRHEWNRAQVICSRKIASREWIWVPVIEFVGKHPDAQELQLDTLQYQLAHGTSPPPKFRTRSYTI